MIVMIYILYRRGKFQTIYPVVFANKKVSVLRRCLYIKECRVCI